MFVAVHLVFGCSTNPGGHGEATVGVVTRGLSAADVKRITVTISGTHFAPDIVYGLYRTGSGAWVGSVGSIPAGTCTFLAQAYDAVSGGSELYSGSATQAVTGGASVTVVIVLNQSTPATPFANTAPLITSLSAAPGQVTPGDTSTVTVGATDADGDTLTYSWSDGVCGGSFSDSTAAPTWTAPATAPAAGSCAIKATVSDGKGGQSSLAITVYVGSQFGTVDAGVDIQINHDPVVSQVVAAAGQIEAGQSSLVTATASDPDGDPMVYTWDDGACAGGFSAATAAPTWTAPSIAPAGGTCSLTVTVTDGKGGSGSGSVTINVTVPNQAPIIDSTTASATSAPAGGTVTFTVIAHDLQSSPLTFAWNKTGGALSTPANSSNGNVYSSQVIWTAPATPGAYTVGVIVSDGLLTTAHNFSVTARAGAWAINSGGANVEYAAKLAVDATGNTFVVGSYLTATTLGSTTLTSAGSYDGYVAKVSPSGSFLWAKNLGGAGSDIATGVGVDGSGNVYVTGYYSAQGTTIGGTAYASRGGLDLFVTKLNGAGQVLWTITAGGTLNDISGGIAVESSGACSIAGYFNSANAAFGLAGTLTTAGGYDLFVARMNSSGVFAWASRTGSSSHGEYGYAVAVNGSGNTWVAGEYAASPTPFGSTNLTASGGTDIFVTRLNSSGQFQGAVGVGNAPSEVLQGVAVDSGGNAYITGSFGGGPLYFDSHSVTSAGSYDVYVAKLDSSWSWQWAKSAGDSYEDRGMGITASAAGDVFITGYHQRYPIFGSTTLSTRGYFDVFLARLNSSGVWQWAESAGGTQKDHGQGVALDSAGSPHVCGSYESTSATFGTTSLTSPSAASDIYVWRRP